MIRSNTQHERKEVYATCIALWFLSWLTIFPFPIKPNIYLVGIIFLAFMMSDIVIFLLVMSGILLWVKYIPGFSYELVVLGGIGIVYTSIKNSIIREPHPMIIGIGVVLGQIIFWMASAPSAIYSFLFVIELFYNILILLILYGIWGWVKKRFN